MLQRIADLIRVSEANVAGRRHATVVFGIYATLTLDLFSSVTSSPQTTELFAADREETLMKYVYIADGGWVLIGGAISVLDASWWPLIAGAAIGIPFHLLYKHAARVGKSKKPPTTASQRAG